MKALRRISYSRRPSSTSVTISPSASAHPWEEDRYKVLGVGASFSVKYLASKEVSQPRGVRVCENAVKATPYRKGKKKMTLTISKGGIRIVDDATKMLAVDQPINKISFCSPDPCNPRIFSYIARDGVTRRWMCHIFVAEKGSTGERLSHALGCAFAACLIDKQKSNEKEKKSDNNTAAQLKNMIKEGVTVFPSQENNLEWLRKQHQMRKQTSSSPSPPHSSTSSSSEFQSRAVEGWQEKAETISFEDELDNMLKNSSMQQNPHSVSPLPPVCLESDSYQLDFSGIVSPQLEQSLSDSFLPVHATIDPFSSKKQANSNQPIYCSPTNDPWQSIPKIDPWQSTSFPNDGSLPLPCSPIKDPSWVHFNTSVASAMPQEHVTLDPWSSKKLSNTVSQIKSTNPWANDVSEVNIAQSVAPTKMANDNSPSDRLQFDPLKFDWTSDDKYTTQLGQDSSDLFNNWDAAVKQMHQLPSYGAPHVNYAWSQQNQISTTKTLTSPSLI